MSLHSSGFGCGLFVRKYVRHWKVINLASCLFSFIAQKPDWIWELLWQITWYGSLLTLDMIMTLLAFSFSLFRIWHTLEEQNNNNNNNNNRNSPATRKYRIYLKKATCLFTCACLLTCYAGSVNSYIFIHWYIDIY